MLEENDFQRRQAKFGRKDKRENMMKQTQWLVRLVGMLLCMTLLVGCASEESAQTDPQQDQVDAKAWETVVAQCGEHSLTNATLSYYFWSGYAAFLNYYDSSAQVYLDLYKPLNEQQYSDDMTWEDYFINNALTAFRQYSAVCDLAQERGYTLSEANAKLLENLEQELLATAQEMGFESAQDYLQTNYGPGATVENYRAYMADYLMVREYIAAAQQEYNFTEQQIEENYDQNASSYAERGVEKEDQVMASVRYLALFSYDQPLETEALGTVTAGEVFEMLMTQWEESEDHSEEAFMKLGEEWSNYGVVQNYVEQMRPNGGNVEEIEDWVFDQERKAGDYLALESDHGYFLVYYSKPCDHPYWYEQSLYDLQYSAFSAIVNEKIESMDFSFEADQIVIAQSQDLYAASE